MNVVAIPIIESNTELQGTRHSSMPARDVGGTTDRNSLSARQANGAAMLVEVDAAAVAVLLLVRLIAEGREVVGRLPVHVHPSVTTRLVALPGRPSPRAPQTLPSSLRCGRNKEEFCP